MSLQPRSPFQLMIRDPQFLPTLVRRAKWGLFIGGCLGILMAMLLVRNLEFRCANEGASCDVLREGKAVMMFTVVVQMALFGAFLSLLSGILRMLIRGVNARDRGLTGPDGKPLQGEQVFHPSWNEETNEQALRLVPNPDDKSKTEAQKHLERFRKK
ncbi:MAG: hypothetical protein KF767_05595 [Bdellovibrionaceae bacterium]|nr:hypothetical protein [Pseudobdellovibrionaceae bacterium]